MNDANTIIHSQTSQIDNFNKLTDDTVKQILDVAVTDRWEDFPSINSSCKRFNVICKQEGILEKINLWSMHSRLPHIDNRRIKLLQHYVTIEDKIAQLLLGSYYYFNANLKAEGKEFLHKAFAWSRPQSVYNLAIALISNRNSFGSYLVSALNKTTIQGMTLLQDCRQTFRKMVSQTFINNIPVTGLCPIRSSLGHWNTLQRPFPTEEDNKIECQHCLADMEAVRLHFERD